MVNNVYILHWNPISHCFILSSYRPELHKRSHPEYTVEGIFFWPVNPGSVAKDSIQAHVTVLPASLHPFIPCVTHHRVINLYGLAACLMIFPYIRCLFCTQSHSPIPNQLPPTSPVPLPAPTVLTHPCLTRIAISYNKGLLFSYVVKLGPCLFDQLMDGTFHQCQLIKGWRKDQKEKDYVQIYRIESISYLLINWFVLDNLPSNELLNHYACEGISYGLLWWPPHARLVVWHHLVCAVFGFPALA